LTIPTKNNCSQSLAYVSRYAESELGEYNQSKL